MSAHRTRSQLQEIAGNNSAVENRMRRRALHCSYCKPDKGENHKGRVPRSDRYKNKRQGRDG
jgi:transposase-like protein